VDDSAAAGSVGGLLWFFGMAGAGIIVGTATLGEEWVIPNAFTSRKGIPQAISRGAVSMFIPT